MPAAWIGSLGGAGAVTRVGELSAAMFAEMRKAAPALIPIITIEFPAKTTTIVRSPTSTTLADAEHIPTGAATIHEALDDPPTAAADDDTSYVRSDLNDDRAESRVAFDPLPTGIISVSEVRLYCRARTHDSTTNPAGAWTHSLVLNSVNYYRDGSTLTERFFNEVYKTICFRFPVNPATTAAWAASEVDGLELAIISQVDANGAAFGNRFTQVWMEADVTTEEIGRYAPVAVNSRSRGVYQPRVISLSTVTRSVLNINNSLEGTGAGCIIADTDREFSDFLAQHTEDELRKSRVTIEYASPNVDPVDWKTVFTGLLATWKEQTTHRWQLSFKPEDRAIDEGVLPTEKISERVFEAAPDPKVYDNFAPLIYGRHDSTQLTDDGMLPTFRVADRDHACSLARLKTILRVFARDQNTVIELTESASDGANNYEVTYPIFNGIQWTFIKLQPLAVTTHLVNASREIVFDCEGYEDVGDGTGFLIENPADVLKHLLVNWVFGRYRSGLWLDEAASRVDLAKFTAARDDLNLLGQAASRYIGGKQAATNVKQELNRFTKIFEIKQFWTGEGKYAIKLNKHNTIDIYPEELVITEGIETIDDPSYDFDERGILNEIFVAYIHKQDEGKFLANLSVADLEVENAGSENIQAFWLPSSLPQAAA